MENPSPKRKKQRQILSAYTPDRLSAIVAKLLEIGIVSFSQELSNTLMWSHYAKNHSGACLFAWKKLYQEGSLMAVGAGESVVAASELQEALKRVKLLERALGRKTLENEILNQAKPFFS